MLEQMDLTALLKRDWWDWGVKVRASTFSDPTGGPGCFEAISFAARVDTECNWRTYAYTQLEMRLQ